MLIKMKIMTIPGAPLEGTNPLPMFHNRKLISSKGSEKLPENLKKDHGVRSRILPYKVQDRYSRRRDPLKMKGIVLENEFLKAVFWPENGGKLYSLYDKKNGRDLLMTNPVYQPGNLAIRNAWHSGGIEFNCGNYGHCYFTCDNLFAAILKDHAGNEFLRMYEFERAKSIVYQMDFHLPEGSQVLYSHVKVLNPFEKDTTTYWWTNIAIPQDGNTRVLSCTDQVLVLGEGMSYEKLPHLSPFGDADLSYPHNATRGYDHFYQTPDTAKTAWEAGADDKGNVFFDRSTAPLLYHKMFCWGNHSAAQRWQDYLSDPGQGNYIEIQAGFARTQLHDKLLRGGEAIEWTQCYGGAALNREALHQESLSAASEYMEQEIEKIISEKDLLARNEHYAQLANMPVKEENLVHLGSGWGALEQERMKVAGEGGFPASMCFPYASMGPEQYPWYALLTEGVLPEETPDEAPASYMVSAKWRPLLEDSLKAGKESWYSWFQYGVMLREAMDEEHIASVAAGWPEYDAFAKAAKEAFMKSVEACPSAWAYRCLFFLEQEEGNDALAMEYYDRAFELSVSRKDFAFAAEYMGYLNKKGFYEKAWEIYDSLPEEIKKEDRMMLCAANTAIKLRKLAILPAVFEREYADIKEGETSLTDIWFEYCALKMAAERGMDPGVSGEALEVLIDEAWDNCPPPAAIDFRMSFQRKNKYRMES